MQVPRAVGASAVPAAPLSSADRPAVRYKEIAPLRAFREETAVNAPLNLREEGRLRVLQALYDSVRTSRPELIRRTGLSRATVSALVADLNPPGLVQEEAGGDEVRDECGDRRAGQAGAADQFGAAGPDTVV